MKLVDALRKLATLLGLKQLTWPTELPRIKPHATPSPFDQRAWRQLLQS